MAQSGVRGEGRRSNGRGAGELGWDDSLYDGSGKPVRGADGDSGQDAESDPGRTADVDPATPVAADGDPVPGTGGRTAEDTMPLKAQGSSGRGSGARRHGGGSRPRRKRRILRWSAMVLAVLILGTAGAGYLYYQHLNDNIKKDELNIGDEKDRAAKTEANAAGQTPLNILLIGSDARDTEENQELGGAKETFGATPLADVQMLLHLSADRTNMSVVSMPRDTLVDIPKCTDPDDGEVYAATTVRTMTNRSLGRGGPGCTVATWEKLTDIHIDHFMRSTSRVWSRWRTRSAASRSVWTPTSSPGTARATAPG